MDVPAWAHENKTRAAVAGAVAFGVIALFPVWLALLWPLFSTRDFVSVMRAHMVTGLLLTALYGWIAVLIGIVLLVFVGLAVLFPHPTVAQALRQRDEALRARDSALSARDEALRARREATARPREETPRATHEEAGQRPLQRSAERLLGFQKADPDKQARVGHADWHTLAEEFRRIRDTAVRADWTRNPTGESWRVCGGMMLANQDCEALCRAAGNMLLASPNVAAVLSPRVKAETTPAWRWLRYVKEAGASFESDVDASTTDGTYTAIGSIDDLPSVSARLCAECSALETVLT